MSGEPTTVYQYCKRCGKVSVKILPNGVIAWGFHRCADLPKPVMSSSPHFDYPGDVRFIKNIKDKRGES